jgi:hypothetical protein
MIKMDKEDLNKVFEKNKHHIYDSENNPKAKQQIDTILLLLQNYTEYLILLKAQSKLSYNVAIASSIATVIITTTKDIDESMMILDSVRKCISELDKDINKD